MEINFTDKNRIKNICIHEAGHNIVARKNSFVTNGISVSFKYPSGHSGESGVQLWKYPIKSFTEIENYLKLRVQVLYAGAIAEGTDIEGNNDFHYAINELRNGASQNDYAKARELMQILRNIKFLETREEKVAQTQLTDIDKCLFNKSIEAVLENINQIHQVGNHLANKVKMYNVKYDLISNEIDEIIQ